MWDSNTVRLLPIIQKTDPIFRDHVLMPRPLNVNSSTFEFSKASIRAHHILLFITDHFQARMQQALEDPNSSFVVAYLGLFGHTIASR